MPATRLLVLADPKMLPALANGLREGAKFDVLTLPFGDPGAAAAAQRADALAVFYGSSARSLQEVVQELAPPVRARGGRVVAVLQRDQTAQRDDCFRAGASDLVFMPLPKEQFVSRLAASVDLLYAAESGVSAPVQVGARGNLVPLAQATVTLAGIHSAAALPFRPGETVRVSWATFECWGLVVKASPAQVRFAGLAPDEEARIREWAHKNGAPAAAPRPVTRPIAPSAAAPRPATGPIAPPAAARPPPPRVAPPSVPAAASAAAAPAKGPASLVSPRPVVASNASPRPVTKPQPPPAAPAAASSLADIMDEVAEPAPAAAPQKTGPAWPTVPDVDLCRTVGVALLQGAKVPAGTSAELAAAAKKVLGVLNVGERTALEKAGPDSHFAAALAARIVLELARSEAQRLVAAQPPPVVDDASVKAITQISDAAAAQLQKQVDVVIGRADVDNLQLLTVANAALSREVLLFKETADRLRGIAAAPRLGAGALDPEIVLPGQLSRPAKTVDRPIVKPELKEFAGLGEVDPHTRRKRLLFVSVLAGAAAAVNFLFFAYPRITDVREQIPGVARIEISGKTARVTIAYDFPEHEGRAVAMLTHTLRERGVERAVLVQRNGSGAGQIAVKEGKTYGLPPAVKRGDVLPVLPTPPAPSTSSGQAQPDAAQKNAAAQ
ncbi:MAG TPA: hypothetical protein VE620_14920, partial [Myxococcales bacterium]|nr:hypothetical protein [Myxococcales bacterium]